MGERLMILRIIVTGGTNASWRKRALFALFFISEYVYVVSMCMCAHMNKSQKLTSEFFPVAVYFIILRWSLTEPMAHHVAGSVGHVLCSPSATGMNML